MDQGEIILEGARSIRPHLNRLLGEEAQGLDSELLELLKQSQDGYQVETLILQALTRHEATRKWFEEYLREKYPPDGNEPEKSYEQLPGRIGLPSPLYRCPQGDFEWYRRSVAIPVPECPTHHILLVQVE